MIVSSQQMWDTMTVKQSIKDVNGKILIENVPAIIKAKTDSMLVNKDRYAAIAQKFVNPGFKWCLVAVIHEMECSQNFNRYLGNGQSFNQVTTIVPKGRGPFKTFDDGAVDALKLQGVDRVTDWSITSVLHFLEGYNGYGYSKFHSMASPYIWSGSQFYSVGKYTGDGNFDPKAVSQQIGVALLLKVIIDK
jgi:lysozyme family protein